MVVTNIIFIFMQYIQEEDVAIYKDHFRGAEGWMEQECGPRPGRQPCM